MESSKLKMIDQYFEGNLPREQWKEFSTHLSQSSELRKEFRKRAVLDEYLHSIASNVDYPALAPEKKFKIIDEEHEGLMIKRIESPYISGRPKGHWFKWKKEPKTVDAILMYAVRGHGKRSSYYSDFTLGLWQGNEILPICKAYFGFSDLELKTLDKFVRNNTLKKYGPVREVEKTFVIEIAFDSVNYSKRHKSGVALRFPRIKRLREDKPVQEVLQLSEFKDEFLNKSL